MRKTLLITALLSSALPSAHAVVTGITNGNFETGGLSSPGEYTGDISGWFESATGNYNDWIMKNSSVMGANQTNILGFSGSAGYVYQQIGTYTANETVTVSGQIIQRANASGSTNNGFSLELLSGNFSGADGTSLTATLLNTVTLDRNALTAAPYNFGAAGTPTAYAANFSLNLNSGTGGTDGVPAAPKL